MSLTWSWSSLESPSSLHRLELRPFQVSLRASSLVWYRLLGWQPCFPLFGPVLALMEDFLQLEGLPSNPQLEGLPSSPQLECLVEGPQLRDLVEGPQLGFHLVIIRMMEPPHLFFILQLEVIL
jgi:hypothetical protein